MTRIVLHAHHSVTAQAGRHDAARRGRLRTCSVSPHFAARASLSSLRRSSSSRFADELAWLLLACTGSTSHKACVRRGSAGPRRERPAILTRPVDLSSDALQLACSDDSDSWSHGGASHGALWPKAGYAAPGAHCCHAGFRLLLQNWGVAVQVQPKML